MAKKNFNINEYVWVKLNAEGHKICLSYCLSYYTKQVAGVPSQYHRNLLAVDDDGYSCFQMWEFMQVFGHYLHWGCDPPFDTTIRINDEDLTD